MLTTLPSPPFPAFPPLPSLTFPATKWPPENQLQGTVSSPSGVHGKTLAANAFWYILSSKIAPGGNILVIYLSFKWCILKHVWKKKQLY